MAKNRTSVAALAALAVVLTACQNTHHASAPPASTTSAEAVTSAAPVSPDGAATPSPTPSAAASSSTTTPAVSSPAVSPSVSATATLPSSAVVSHYAGRDIARLPTTQHVVALTFDAGANADAIPKILAALRAAGVPGTFFLTGTWVKLFPQQAAEVGAAYPVGSHSMTHPYFTKLSGTQITGQLTDAEAAIKAATGRDPRPLFRFPYGDRDARTRTVVNADGYVSVLWTVDTLGWEGTSGGQSVASVTQRVMANLQPGEIVLMHVGSHPTDHSTLDGDALPAVIARIKAAGYGFVTIPQGLALN